MAHRDEPSVEEILSSIKQVIARDNRTAATRRRTIVADPVDEEEADDVLDLADEAIRADEAAYDVEDEGEIAEPEMDSPLLDDVASASMRESLAALATLAQPGARPQIVRSGETSLEGLVREMLRPMLAEWLDANLPPLVERMVQAEIARIAGKRG